MTRTDSTNGTNAFTSRKSNDGFGPELIGGVLYNTPRKHHRAPCKAEAIAEQLNAEHDALAFPVDAYPGLSTFGDAEAWLNANDWSEFLPSAWHASIEPGDDSTTYYTADCALATWECELLRPASQTCDKHNPAYLIREVDDIEPLLQGARHLHHEEVSDLRPKAHEGHNPKESTVHTTTRTRIGHSIPKGIKLHEQPYFTDLRDMGVRENDAMRIIEQQRGNRHDHLDTFREQSRRRTAQVVLVPATV